VSSVSLASWALLILALVQVVDAMLCWRPAAFVADCLRDVRFPHRWWPVLTPLKLAAAVGLLLGTRIAVIAVLTCGALVVYFIVAIVMHVRADDYGRNLFVNASGMLLLCLGTLALVVAEG